MKNKRAKVFPDHFNKVLESHCVTALLTFHLPELSRMSISISKREWEILTLFWMAPYMTRNSVTVKERENRHWETSGNLYHTHLESCGEVMHAKSFQNTLWGSMYDLFYHHDTVWKKRKVSKEGIEVFLWTTRDPLRMWKDNANTIIGHKSFLSPLISGTFSLLSCRSRSCD